MDRSRRMLLAAAVPAGAAALLAGTPGEALAATTVTTTIAGLRALTTPDAGSVYYVSDSRRQGFFWYDPTDSSSTDDGGIVLVGTSGARYKRLFDGPASADWFGVVADWKSDASPGTDQGSALTAAIAATAGKVALRIPPGDYRINDSVTLLSGTTLIGDNATLHLVNALTSETAILRNTGVSNIRIEGLNFVAAKSTGWAIRLAQAGNVTITRCRTTTAGLFCAVQPAGTYADITDAMMCKNIVVSDCVLTGTDTTSVFGAITMTYTDGFRIERNRISGYRHGIQWWGGDSDPAKDGAVANTRKCRNGSIVGNSVHDCFAGGIWGSMGARINVSDNQVTTVGDVGIDFEGCTYCTATGNTVVNATHGALTTFYYCRGVVFTGNSVQITDPSITEAVWVRGDTTQQLNNREVAFVANSFAHTGGSIATVINEGVGSLVFSDNQCRNIRIGLTGPAGGRIISGNTVVYDVTAGTAFAALAGGNDIGTTGVTEIIGNNVRSGVTQPAGSSGVYASQNDTGNFQQALVADNAVRGFDIDIKINASAATGVAHRFHVRDNVLGNATYVRADTTTGTVVRLDGNTTGGAQPYPSAVPTAGQWDTGQHIRYAVPSSTGYLAAVCTSGGSPGSWREYAAIAP